MQVCPKYLYLARRNSKFDRQQFQDRWRQHGQLAMGTARWRHVKRYAQCDIVPLRIPGLDETYDGIGIVWPLSMEDRLAYRADTETQHVLEADELSTFDGHVLHHSVLCNEIHLKRADADALRLFRFLWRPAGMPVETFTSQWQRHLEQFAARAAALGVIGCTMNVPLPPERPQGWGLDVCGIEEFALDCAASVPDLHRALAPVPDLYARVLSVVVKPVILDERA